MRFSSAKCWDMVRNEAVGVRQYAVWVIDGGIYVREGTLAEGWWTADDEMEDYEKTVAAEGTFVAQ